MNILSTTLKTMLSISAILFMGHIFMVYKVHKSLSYQHEFFDHRHQSDPIIAKSAFEPVIITPGHLSSELYLPDALRLPLYTNKSARTKNNPFGACCEMLSIKRRNPKNLQCEGICNTERACTDELYPFKSDSQFQFFTEMKRNETNMQKLRLQCRRMNHLLSPPFKWCHQWMDQSKMDAEDVTTMHAENIDFVELEKYNHQNINPIQANLPPPGCSHTSEGGGSGAYQHLTLFTEAKLAFCGIPKVSITQWLQFLRFTFGAKDYQAFPHAKPDVKLMRFDKLKHDSQMKILNDPEWKFAVFLRDPAERLLSAYLDKVNGTQKRDRDHFLLNYNMTETPSFSDFVNAISQNRTEFELGVKSKEKLRGVDWFTDPHWRPQSFSCGLSEFLPRFSYIGSLDKMENQARELLQRVDLWEKYGKFYHRFSNTNGMKRGICALEPPPLTEGEELFGFLQLPRTGNTDGNGSSYRHSHHSTGSQSKIDDYYTSELKFQVEEQLYPMDMKLWRLIEDEEGLVSGSELAAKISSQCQAKAHQLVRSR